ncbi:MAG: cytochrome c biogenesis protein CcdA [Oscillospiraceae bacterium]
MQYLILFLEGIITFISPCLLPMLPIYISYFTANDSNNIKNGRSKALTNAIGFVIGFSLVFIALGTFAGTVGKLLRDYSTIFNIITGLIVVIFGLNFLGVLKIGFLNLTHIGKTKTKDLGFFSAILFGVVFSIGWTPCVGAFLASALLLASQQGSALEGTLMLLTFSLGLGIPFIVSAVLVDQLKSTFDFIKKNYKVINIISGGLLVIIGILMMTGYMGYFLSLLTF